MSQGVSCKCPESKKPARERNWVVLQRNCNHSAFNGYHRQFSEYSSLRCLACDAVWRTKADYVLSVRDEGHVPQPNPSNETAQAQAPAPVSGG